MLTSSLSIILHNNMVIAAPAVLTFCPVFTTAAPVRAKASKIVAGQEPEKTNEFLQVIGIAILKKVN